MHCPSCRHEVLDEELETPLEVVPQQIFVLGADLHVEYANKAVVDYHGEALATLVDLLACVARIRLVASEPVLAAAEECCARIMSLYEKPNRRVEKLHAMIQSGEVAIFRRLSDACREELRRFTVR